MTRFSMRPRSLRGSMVLTFAAFAGALTLLMVSFVWYSQKTHATLDESAAALKLEQRIADQIVSEAYGQQLAAFRHLQTGSASTLRDFRQHGTRAYEEINRYLFRDMPLSSRLKVESIKEAHQDFEVAAQQAFDLAMQGATEEARSRAESLSDRTAVLEGAVRSFMKDREAQRDAQRSRVEARLLRVQSMTALAAVIGVALAMLLAELVRRRMMRPLGDLSDAVRRLREDEETVHVARQRYSEFRVLAESFDAMAQRIRASRRELEERNADLTRTLEDLRRAQQDLVQHEKLSAVGEMLAGLAHELNNPLGGVLGLGEVLQAELAESPDAQARALVPAVVTPLVAEAVRARHLVRNLLHFSRQSAPQLETVSLAGAVDVAVGLRQYMFAQEQKRLTIDVPAELRVVAQEQKLQHVIINVVNNALDALRDERGSALTISATRHGDDVLLRFDDDGPGFREPGRAFDPFYTTKPVGSGTGLGLTLVHRFAQEFGGAVTAENRVEGGARVTVRLRGATTHASEGAGVVCPPVRAAVPACATADRPRVLVVDDEPALREVQRRVLRRLNLEVVLAASGVEARNAIRATRFDLVITDLRMPGEMSGRDLLEWLSREFPALADRALVVTGDVSGDANACLPGFPPERIVLKPFDRADYERRVQEALAEARQPA